MVLLRCGVQVKLSPKMPRSNKKWEGVASAPRKSTMAPQLEPSSLILTRKTY